VQVPASALPLHLKEVWSVIHSQKDLDLPAHKVMVAHIRCRDIAAEQLQAVINDVAWQELLKTATSGTEMADFSARSSSLIESCLYGYDTDAMYFVDAVRSEQKEELQEQLYAALKPAYDAQCKLQQNKLVKDFRAQLTAAAEDPAVRFADVATSTSQKLVQQYDGVSLRFWHCVMLDHPKGCCQYGAVSFVSSLPCCVSVGRRLFLREIMHGLLHVDNLTFET
jgi:hypothetical protein